MMKITSSWVHITTLFNGFKIFKILFALSIFLAYFLRMKKTIMVKKKEGISMLIN